MSSFSETYQEAHDTLMSLTALLTGTNAMLESMLESKGDINAAVCLIDLAKEHSESVKEMIEEMRSLYLQVEKAGGAKKPQLDS